MEEYGVYSAFDLQKHKKTFVDYLEVLILEDGTVKYAVPSHQSLAIRLACEKLGVDLDTLLEQCPPECRLDFMPWLLSLTNAIAVWTRTVEIGEKISKKQIAKLKLLKTHGLYKGPIPQP